MIISQNFVQKMFNLISVEFITNRESIKKYNQHHVNLVFFNIKNTQEVRNVLIEKFSKKECSLLLQIYQ